MKYFDNATLYMKSGVATIDQVTESLTEAYKDASKLLGKFISPDFEINIIYLRDGKKVGYGYVRVKDKIMYNLLSGANIDGSERIIYVDDPSWIEPNHAPVLNFGNGTSWADIAEEEESMECPQIKKKLDPLIKIKGYSLSKEQMEEMRELIISTAKRSDKYNEDFKTEISDNSSIEFSRAFVLDIDPSFCHNVLCGKTIPQSISIKLLKKIFSNYASDSTTVIKRKVKDQIINDTYPIVTMNNDNTVFITFDPAKEDARFALLMTRKIIVEGFTLYFTHSYKSKFSK